MGERTPLLHYRLAASGHEDSGEHRTREESAERRAVRRRSAHGQPQKLSTFFGVVIPTLLSMFSVVVFLRIGECVCVCVETCTGKTKHSVIVGVVKSVIVLRQCAFCYDATLLLLSFLWLPAEPAYYWPK